MPVIVAIVLICVPGGLGLGGVIDSTEDIHRSRIFDPGLILGKGLRHGGGKETAATTGFKIDTDRDGIDIDYCKNVRVSNCSINSPWDAICPKSSFALGYARATENVPITNCFVTGDYQVGSVLDGTWKRHTDPGLHRVSTGRIKCGTKSNGGFKNITISNCVFESCRGLALETVDGAICEDITFTGIAMRDLRQSPLFVRLGARLRGPSGTKVGTLKRIVMSTITSVGADPLCTNISGMSGYMIEDLKISDVSFHQRGALMVKWKSVSHRSWRRPIPNPRCLEICPRPAFLYVMCATLQYPIWK